MKDFDQLMSVWQGQPVHDKLSVDDVLKQVKKDVKGIAGKLLWSIIAMAAVLVNTFVVMFFLVFKSWLTYVGILIMLVSMFFYLLLIVRHYRIINKRDKTVNPTDYLMSLKVYQRNRAKLSGWFYYMYVLMITLGLSLYFVEVLASSTLMHKIMFYGITIIWILFCTFYLKARIFKNEREKLDVMIDRLERLKSQFE